MVEVTYAQLLAIGFTGEVRRKAITSIIMPDNFFNIGPILGIRELLYHFYRSTKLHNIHWRRCILVLPIVNVRSASQPQ